MAGFPSSSFALTRRLYPFNYLSRTSYVFLHPNSLDEGLGKRCFPRLVSSYVLVALLAENEMGALCALRLATGGLGTSSRGNFNSLRSISFHNTNKSWLRFYRFQAFIHSFFSCSPDLFAFSLPMECLGEVKILHFVVRMLSGERTRLRRKYIIHIE